MPASKPEQRIEEGSPLWNRRAHELALNFCPPKDNCWVPRAESVLAELPKG